MAQGPAQASGPSGPKTQGGACTGQTLDYATGPRAHCRQLWRRGAIQTDVLRNLQRTEGPGLRAQSGANVRRVRTLRCHRVLTGLKSALDLAGPWALGSGPCNHQTLRNISLNRTRGSEVRFKEVRFKLKEKRLPSTPTSLPPGSSPRGWYRKRSLPAQPASASRSV